MRSQKVPSYSLHKASGRAVVRLSGKDHYLGQYGSVESHDSYNRIIAEWLATQRSRQPSNSNEDHLPAKFSVAQVIERYKYYAATYYVKDGVPTKEYVNLKYTLKPLRELYGATPACNFGPKNLKAMQQHFISQKICRTQINKRTDKSKRMFKWTVSEELVTATVLEGLRVDHISGRGLFASKTSAVQLSQFAVRKSPA